MGIVVVLPCKDWGRSGVMIIFVSSSWCSSPSVWKTDKLRCVFGRLIISWPLLRSPRDTSWCQSWCRVPKGLGFDLMVGLRMTFLWSRILRLRLWRALQFVPPAKYPLLLLDLGLCFNNQFWRWRVNIRSGPLRRITNWIPRCWRELCLRMDNFHIRFTRRCSGEV